jgi:hypothetical protein
VCDATTRYAGFTFNDRLNDDDAARAPLGETETCPIASAAISTDEMAAEGRSTTSPAWVL